MEDQLSAAGCSVNVFLEGAKANFAALQFFNQGYQVFERSPQAIEPPDSDRESFSGKLRRFFDSRAISFCPLMVSEEIFHILLFVDHYVANSDFGRLLRPVRSN